jgi:O-antigen/teichoic acid export membrane protein
MQQLTQQFLRSIDKIVVYSITGIVTTLCIIIFSFLFIPKGGVKGYVLAIILANIVTIIYSFVHGKIWKYVSIKSVNGNSLKEMLQYSIPLIPNGIMWFLISSFNRPVLESSVGLAAVGLFAVAGRIPNMLNTLYLLFQNAWIISAVEEFHKESYKEFFNRMLKFVVIVQSVFAAILALSAKWIITVFTTEEYYSAWQYIPLLVVGVIFMNGASFVGTNFAVTKKSKFYFYSTVWSGLSSVVFNIMLIPPYGLWGACWAMLISQAVCLIFRIIYSWHIVKITNLWFYLLNIALLFIVSIGCVYISSTTQKILFISAIILCFFAVNAKMIYSLLCTIKVRIKQV